MTLNEGSGSSLPTPVSGRITVTLNEGSGSSLPTPVSGRITVTLNEGSGSSLQHQFLATLLLSAILVPSVYLHAGPTPFRSSA